MPFSFRAVVILLPIKPAPPVTTYMNYCPDAKLLLFLNDLFKTASLQNMLLSLRSIIKNSKNFVKKSSLLTLNMLLEKFELCHFQNIDDLTIVTHGLPNSSKCKMKLG